MRARPTPWADETSTSRSISMPSWAMTSAGRQNVVAPVSTRASSRVTQRTASAGMTPRAASTWSPRLVMVSCVRILPIAVVVAVVVDIGEPPHESSACPQYSAAGQPASKLSAGRQPVRLQAGDALRADDGAVGDARRQHEPVAGGQVHRRVVLGQVKADRPAHHAQDLFVRMGVDAV